MSSNTPPAPCDTQATPWWRDTLTLVVPCSALGLLFWLFGMGPWWMQLLIANGIGLTMRSSIRWQQRRFPSLSMLHNTLLALLLVVVLWYGGPTLYFSWYLDHHVAVNPTVVVIVVLVSAGMTYFYYLLEQKHALKQALIQAELTQTQQEKQLLQQQLRLLQSQIEPHFLFNTLANIQALIRVEPKQASQMLAALTTLLRQSLSQSRAEQIRLADELAFSRAYLQIQQIRFGDRLQLDWQQDDGLPLEALVPPVMLQPLLENAMQHGIEPRRGEGRLCVSLRYQPQRLICTIGNDTVAPDVPLPSSTHAQQTASEASRHDHGIALANTRERLRQHYGEAARLELTRPSETWVEVVMEIPL